MKMFILMLKDPVSFKISILKLTTSYTSVRYFFKNGVKISFYENGDSEEICPEARQNITFCQPNMTRARTA